MRRPVLILAMALLAASGCSKGRLFRPRADQSTLTIPGTPGRGIVSGGVVSLRRQTSIVGLAKSQTVLSSPNLRVISNLQGTVYSD